MVDEYEKAVGHPPENRFANDPDWLYSTMTVKEREEYLRELVPQPEQEKLFDE